MRTVMLYRSLHSTRTIIWIGRFCRILFQRIVIVLNNHYSHEDTAAGQSGTAAEHSALWLRRTLGHLKEISRLYRREISSFISTLDTVRAIHMSFQLHREVWF